MHSAHFSLYISGFVSDDTDILGCDVGSGTYY